MRWLRDPSHLLDRIVHARSSLVALFGFSFLEGAILPVPIEAVIVPFMALRRDILWWIAGIALAGFFASALVGYAIGALFYDQVGAPLIAAMGWHERFAGIESFLEAYGFWAVIALGLTPLPTQILMIGAGAFGVPVAAFVTAVLLGRGARNFGVAALVFCFGDQVVQYFRHRHALREAARHPEP